MAVVSARVRADPGAVFAVLADGWLYPLWVVGTSHPRAVDAAWPARGSRLHHASGVWPFVVRDHTEVLEVDPDRYLKLKARGWPFGEAMISITLAAEADGATLVTLDEQPVKFPGALLRNPVADAALHRRNVEALARLAAVVERRTTPDPDE